MEQLCYAAQWAKENGHNLVDTNDVKFTGLNSVNELVYTSEITETHIPLSWISDDWGANTINKSRYDAPLMMLFDFNNDKVINANNFAISSEGIGVALEKSAAALAGAGNSIEESIGLITAMNSVVQNPEVVGTAVKTLTMYLRAAKAEAEEAGEDTEGMANSVSELRDSILALTNNKIDIMIDEKNFKSTYQIIKEIATVWEDMAEVDQAALLKLIAGKRNANSVQALITNFSDAEEAMLTASDSDGSATTENEKYLDSIDGKISQLKATWETFSNTVLSSSVIKSLIDGSTDILNTLDKIIEETGSLTALAIGGGIFGAIKSIS